LLQLQVFSIGKWLFIFCKPFNTFWRLNSLFDHENSNVHRDCLNKWYEFRPQLHIHQTVDEGMQNVLDKELKKWRTIICIIIDVVLFLSKQNLFFRDHRQDVDSKNKVTFLKL